MFYYSRLSSQLLHSAPPRYLRWYLLASICGDVVADDFEFLHQDDPLDEVALLALERRADQLGDVRALDSRNEAINRDGDLDARVLPYGLAPRFPDFFANVEPFLLAHSLPDWHRLPTLNRPALVLAELLLRGTPRTVASAERVLREEGPLAAVGLFAFLGGDPSHFRRRDLLADFIGNFLADGFRDLGTDLPADWFAIQLVSGHDYGGVDRLASLPVDGFAIFIRHVDTDVVDDGLVDDDGNVVAD